MHKGKKVVVRDGQAERSAVVVEINENMDDASVKVVYDDGGTEVVNESQLVELLIEG